MATGGHVNLGEKLICSFCQEDVNMPKTLSCLHAFCERCIANMECTARKNSFNYMYSCPVCRIVVTLLDPESDKHEDKSNQITTVSDNEMDNLQECHVCKRLNNVTKAVNWCRECQEALCDNCTRIHSAIKTSASHKVIQIEEVMDRFNLKEGVTDTCPKHESIIAKFYCSEHDEICCELCLIYHRKCEDVRAIVDIIEDTKKGVDVFQKTLQTLSLSTRSLVENIKEEKSHHENSFKDIENSVRNTVQTIKDSLDSLLIVFIKELNLKQDEIEISADSDLRKTEDLLRVISEAENSFRIVQKYGTVVQLFVYMNKNILDFGKKMEVMIHNIDSEGKRASFVLSDFLENTLKLGSIGELVNERTERTFYSEIQRLVSYLKPKSSILLFYKANVKRIKTISLTGFDIIGGLSIDNEHIILCNKNGKSLCIVGTTSTSIVKAESFAFAPKRLAFDIERNMLFVSCYGGYIYMTKIDVDKQRFEMFQTIKEGEPFVGSVCLSNETAYLIVGDNVRKLRVGQDMEMENCFKVNTYCANCVNGFAVTKKNNFVYTSKKYEVVGVSSDGKQTIQ